MRKKWQMKLPKEHAYRKKKKKRRLDNLQLNWQLKRLLRQPRKQLKRRKREEKLPNLLLTDN